jgi:hypothetical protein
MSATFKNILAVISGLILGSGVNILLINISGSIIPPPNGADVSTVEGLKAALPLFEPKHFLFPFLAHALGTLTGALFATMIAKSKQRALSLIIGILFLIGGIMNVVMLPSPIWFTVTDLLFAYIPMVYLGYSLGMNFKK